LLTVKLLENDLMLQVYALPVLGQTLKKVEALLLRYILHGL